MSPTTTGAAPDREFIPGQGLAIAIGILLIIGGSLALLTSVLTSLLSVLLLGGMLIAVGILEIVSAVRARHARPFAGYLLAGVLSLVVGALIVWEPIAGLASVTLLIGGYFLASGLFRGIAAIADRYPRWGWDMLYAAVAIALGAIVVALWPLSSLWVVGTLVAAEIIARGIALLAAAIALGGDGGHRPASMPGHAVTT